MLTRNTEVEPPACVSDTGSACRIIWDATGNSWLAENSHWLVVKPLRILLIVAVCLLARMLINRAVKRFSQNKAETKVPPAILRPLKERMPNLMVDTDTHALLGDRRRQRAETIGSVLRSLVTWLVFSIMFLLILSEFDLNLGPLLASAGVAGVAIGFGAQALVKDVISGLFMILEDQYGVGDVVDFGEAFGTVEVVGLRVTTVRDLQGTLWYVRNGEVLRVGNTSQGWAQVILDVPLGPTVDVDAAGEAIMEAATELAEDSQWSDSIIGEPETQGVVDINVDGAVCRLILKTNSTDQWAIGRELRRRVSRHLLEAGISAAMSDNRVYVRRGGTTQTNG